MRGARRERPGLALGLRERFHTARAGLFLRLLDPRPGSTLLDLGGGTGDFASRLVERVELDVTVADVHDDHNGEVEARGLGFARVPESGPLPFDDRRFDIVLSNSVIEHATLPKERCRVTARVASREWRREARAAQARFAREVRRVGRGYFVQTPHRHFPIDPHVHLPFVQYLSHDLACRLVASTDRWWVKSCEGIVDWELLTPRRMARLFPDGAVHVERFLGLPKSLVAWRRPAAGHHGADTPAP